MTDVVGDPPLRSSLLTESSVLAERLLLQWRRNPVVPLQALLFPTILLVVYYLLISKSMTRLTGGDGLDVVVSMCALAGGFSGALAAGLSIPTERDAGLLGRFWVQPIHRASPLTGTLLAEAARTLVATLLITGIGMVLGMRLSGGVLAAIVFVCIPVLWVTVYAALVIVVALRFRSRTVLTWLSMVSLGLVFGSSGVAPIELFPAWLRPIVQFQPMSPTIEAMRALARDGFELRSLSLTVAWLAAVGVVMGILAVRTYRSAVESV